MAQRNYGDRGDEERNRWGGGSVGEEGRGGSGRDWGAGERSLGWGTGEEEQSGRAWSSGREGSREVPGGRGYWGEESRGGYGNSGGGFGREGERGTADYRRDIDWRSERGYGGQGYRGSQGSDYGYSSGGGTTGQPWQGPYTGRGPQGYQRSNERIQEEVCEILTRHGQVDASGITVEVSDGEVTLTGTVNSRLEKRLAENAIENLSGVRDIHNQLRIAGRGGNGGTPSEISSGTPGLLTSSGEKGTQSARGSSTASGTSSAAGTTGATGVKSRKDTSEGSKSRRRT